MLRGKHRSCLRNLLLHFPTVEERWQAEPQSWMLRSREQAYSRLCRLALKWLYCLDRNQQFVFGVSIVEFTLLQFLCSYAIQERSRNQHISSYVETDIF